MGPSLIRCVLSRFIRAKGAFVFIAITVIGTALSYAMPYVNGKFLDFLLGNRSERDAVLFALLVASIGVLYKVENGLETVDPQIWAGALKSAERVIQQYGEENLGPYSDFEWGMLNGKLSALRWVMGEDWDELYT